MSKSMSDFIIGDEVWVRAKLVRRLHDARPIEWRGWEVKTTRGIVYVEPYDICAGGGCRINLEVDERRHNERSDRAGVPDGG